ncbi:MAG: sugar nucleotide-binding protein [Candidatus Pacebacteria bacterium]|nr:sugar nucleotide-binding protein [Candidatus Paceibacterota bacterium]
MNKQSLIATGLNGLVGSKFASDFAESYSFDRMDISDKNHPVDITNLEQVREVFKNSSAKFVLHLAAFTNVTAAWEQSGDYDGIAYQVNVEGTKNIIKACQEFDKHLIHISTAYVFDGENDEMYKEEDELCPIEWYGQTKADAEQEVRKSDIDWTILRIDQPFRSDIFPKVDVVHRIIEGIKNNNLYPQFTDHYFGPTFIDDFAKVIDWVIRTKASGLYNATSGEMWSDFDFATMINQTLDLGGEVKEGKLEDYLKTISRPYQRNTALDSSKLISQLDFKLKTIQEAISTLK